VTSAQNGRDRGDLARIQASGGSADLARRPQLGIEITLPAKTAHIHASTTELDTLPRQTQALLDEFSTARDKGKATIGSNHAMPWQGHTLTGLAQDPANQTRSSRQSCASGNLAVAGDAPARNCQDRIADSMLFVIERFFH
jgi:hypothetical protein